MKHTTLKCVIDDSLDEDNVMMPSDLAQLNKRIVIYNEVKNMGTTVNVIGYCTEEDNIKVSKSVFDTIKCKEQGTDVVVITK